MCYDYFLMSFIIKIIQKILSYIIVKLYNSSILLDPFVYIFKHSIQYIKMSELD